jgi:hypothetical protein
VAGRARSLVPEKRVVDDRRFDSLAKTFAGRTSRRGAVLGGLAAGLAVLVGVRLDGRGAAQNPGTPGASPAASPGATPGLLHVLSGTPPATNDPSAQARHIGLGDPLHANCCKNPQQCELNASEYVCV